MAAEKLKVHASEPEEEEDLIDPMDEIRRDCAENHCSNLFQKLTECNDRVNSRKKTTESCAEELLDMLHCRDHCATDKIFKHLK